MFRRSAAQKGATQGGGPETRKAVVVIDLHNCPILRMGVPLHSTQFDVSRTVG